MDHVSAEGLILRTCKICGEAKELNSKNFPTGTNKRNGVKKVYFYKTCKNPCFNKQTLIKTKRYKQKNRKKLAEKQKEYYKNHKEEAAEYKSKWYKNNKEKLNLKSKKYHEENKDKLRVKKNEYRKKKEKNNPQIKLRSLISKRIREALKKNGKSKNGSSILKKISYSIEQLKQHLESLFESWMNWNNWGIYRPKTWKDKDQSTWKWQIDHIIPSSKFKYSSMDDEDFKKCWSLENLRPYSAKQNIIDGDRRF